ncbi:D-alanyl-D-alanine carboxypeptidase family protein [Cohnella abietis]|uniref:D-alanyl-D-alanine carboxypeptidase-like core domain-containing protein n=1 Tax=Cohnella abietis TaxID=2507935 RepID=A0A3T1DAE8_9BACL|nr:D-alanyl-D-alanine carboxypeptidase family protein [Cohnella abietis]BBI35060.1 hypothetical protein KCTCHS21_44590 [Cohnella abietis]
MNKRIVFSAAIGIIAIGVLWSKAEALTHSKPETAPIVASPSTKPTPKPSPEPSVAPSGGPTEPTKQPIEEPSVKPTDKPTGKPTPTGNINPPVKQPVKPADITALLAANLPELNFKKDSDGKIIVTNTSSNYILVNKKRMLSSTYVPKDLTVPNVPFSFSGSSPKKQMRREAALALESLFKAAKKDKIDLKAVSGYRSYATQKSIFQSNSDKKGEEVANRTSARPGQSEHQTGLAMDVSSASAGYDLVEKFGETTEGKWLAKHAAEHGFIIRFLKGKESITGYSYEPWHIRYIGKEVAKDITNKKVTLEQYFDTISATVNK